MNSLHKNIINSKTISDDSNDFVIIYLWFIFSVALFARWCCWTIFRIYFVRLLKLF